MTWLANLVQLFFGGLKRFVASIGWGNSPASDGTEKPEKPFVVLEVRHRVVGLEGLAEDAMRRLRSSPNSTPDSMRSEPQEEEAKGNSHHNNSAAEPNEAGPDGNPATHGATSPDPSSSEGVNSRWFRAETPREGEKNPLDISHEA